MHLHALRNTNYNFPCLQLIGNAPQNVFQLRILEALVKSRVHNYPCHQPMSGCLSGVWQIYHKLYTSVLPVAENTQTFPRNPVKCMHPVKTGARNKGIIPVPPSLWTATEAELKKQMIKHRGYAPWGKQPPAVRNTGLWWDKCIWKAQAWRACEGKGPDVHVVNTGLTYMWCALAWGACEENEPDVHVTCTGLTCRDSLPATFRSLSCSFRDTGQKQIPYTMGPGGRGETH